MEPWVCSPLARCLDKAMRHLCYREGDVGASAVPFPLMKASQFGSQRAKGFWRFTHPGSMLLQESGQLPKLSNGKAERSALSELVGFGVGGARIASAGLIAGKRRACTEY